MLRWSFAFLVAGVAILPLGCGLGGAANLASNSYPSVGTDGYASTGATTPAAKSVAGTYTAPDGSTIVFDSSGLVSVELGSDGSKAKDVDKAGPTPSSTPTTQPVGPVPPPPNDGTGHASGDQRPILARPFKDLDLRDLIRFHRQEVQKTITSTWSNENLTVDSTLEYTRGASQATDTGWTTTMTGTLTRKVTLGASYGDLAGSYQFTRAIAGDVVVVKSEDGNTLTATISGSITTTSNNVPPEAHLPIPRPDWSKTVTITLTKSSV